MMRKNGGAIGIVTLTILIGLLPVSVVPSDVCGIEDIEVAAVQPCPVPPPAQVIPGMVCDASYMASCTDVRCRCAVYVVCIPTPLGRLCTITRICEEFISTRVQFPRCRPRQNAQCHTRPDVCGTYFKYLGWCGGIRIGRFDGYISTCR